MKPFTASILLKMQHEYIYPCCQRIRSQHGPKGVTCFIRVFPHMLKLVFRFSFVLCSWLRLGGFLGMHASLFCELQSHIYYTLCSLLNKIVSFMVSKFAHQFGLMRCLHVKHAVDSPLVHPFRQDPASSITKPARDGETN
jgi:hypothetical protein